MRKALRIWLFVTWVLGLTISTVAQVGSPPRVTSRSLNNIQLNEIVEGCASGVFTFYNAGSRFTPTTYIIEFAGTAQIGADYDTITARRVVVPERIDSVSLPISPIVDNLSEGVESIFLLYTANGISDTATLFLRDFPRVDAGKDTAFCEAETVQLNPIGFDNALEYSWSPAALVDDPNTRSPFFKHEVTGDQAVVLSLVATDGNGCSAQDSVSLFLYDQPLSVFSGPTKLCLGSEATFSFVGEATANARYDWDFGADAQVTGGGRGPYVVNWDMPGTKTVCLTVTDSLCTFKTYCQNVEIGIAPDIQIEPVEDQCFEGHSFSFALTDSVEVDSYTWSFGSGALSGDNSLAQPVDITYESPGPKTISLVVFKDGCTSGATAQFELADPPGAAFSLAGDIFCKDACILPRYEGPILGPEQRFEWEFGSSAIPSQSGIPNPVCTRYSEVGTQLISLTVSYKGCIEQQTQTIEIQDLPIASVEVGLDTSFCEGTGGVELSSSITGAAGEVSYNWFSNYTSPGIEDPTLSNPLVNPITPTLPATLTYYLVVETQNGCSSNVDSVKVRVKPLPKADAGIDRVYCEDSPGVLLLGSPAEDNLAPGPFRYEWFPRTGLSDPDRANPLAKPTGIQTYSLQLHSLEGCSSILNPNDSLQTTTVTQQAIPNISAGSALAICTGDTVRLNGQVLSGGPDLQYTWTPTQTGYIEDSSLLTPLVSPQFTTIYSLVAAEKGCQSKASQVEVTVKARPTATVNAALSICLGEAVQLSGIAATTGQNPNEAFTYLWSHPESLDSPNIATPFASPDTTTTYTFQAISEEGCVSLPALSTVTVRSSPLVSILSDKDFLCPGDSLILYAEANFSTTLPGSPLTFEWGPTEQFFAEQRFADSLLVTQNQTTEYFLIGSISGDCPDTTYLQIQARNLSDIQILTSDTSLCQGETTELWVESQADSIALTWLSPELSVLGSQSLLQAQPDSSMTYYVVKQERGCIDTVAVPIEVIPGPKSAFFTSETSGCVDFSVAFIENTENALSLIWDFGDGSPPSNGSTPIHIYEQPGTYEVSLTAIGPTGCTSYSEPTEIVVSDTAFANFSSNPLPQDTLYIPNAEVQFVDASLNPVSWFWKFGDGKSATEKSPKHEYWQPGTYEVVLVVTDVNGCVSQKALGTYVVINPEVFIPNVFTPNFDEVGDFFSILYAGAEPVETRIFDRWGKKVYEGAGRENAWDGNYPNGEWAPEGVYYYEIQVGTTTHTGHLTLLR